MGGRGARTTALGVAAACLLTGLGACGGESAESADDPATPADGTADAESAASDATETGGPTIDCAAIDPAAVEEVAGGAVVEVSQKGTNDSYTHTVGDREFEGASTGCDIDLDIGDFGPPELTVGVYAMDDDFYAFFEETAAVEDGFAAVADVGDAAFTYSAPASRTDLVADLGGQVLAISLGRGLDGPTPESDDLVAIAGLVTPALG